LFSLSFSRFPPNFYGGLGKNIPVSSIDPLTNPLSELLLLGRFRVPLDLRNGFVPCDGHDFMDRAADVGI